MRYGFTGTRSIDGYESDIRDFLDANTQDGTEFTTGACRGFDSLAARYLLERFPTGVHRLVVPANRSQIDGNLITVFAAVTLPGWALIEYMPTKTDYRDRNVRILDHTDRLLAVADYPEDHGKSRRSGTWQTVRLARKRHAMQGKITVKELHPDD